MKMITDKVLEWANIYCRVIKFKPAGEGPIAIELTKIACMWRFLGEYHKYRNFCIAFVTVNRLSLVTWPAGQPHDHCNKDGEGLVNKIVLTLLSYPKQDIGRGGSLCKHAFVFALLDWGSYDRQARAYYVYNLT